MIRRPPRSTLFSLHDALPIYAYADYQAPEVSEDRWDSWGADNSFNLGNNNSGRAFDQDSKTINAVTCWESNNMGDLSHYTTYNDANNNQHHGHDQAQDQGHLSNDDNDMQTEEHTSELQSHSDLVCRLLLEKKKKKTKPQKKTQTKKKKKQNTTRHNKQPHTH